MKVESIFSTSLPLASVRATMAFHSSEVANSFQFLVAVYGGQMDETGKIHRQPDLAAMRRDVFSSSVSDARTRTATRAGTVMPMR